MNKWNSKRFSIYDKEEKQVLGLLNNLGEQTNFNTDEIERLTISDNKKVSHEEMKSKYKIDENADFTGSWFGIKRPTQSNEGLASTVEQIIDETIPNINSQLEHIDNKKLDKEGIIHEANLGQDILEKFTGGVIAVTEVGATNVQNLHDNLAYSLCDFKDIINDYTSYDGWYKFSTREFVSETGYNTKYIRISCSKGDRFNITSSIGGDEAQRRAWCMLGSDGSIISKSDSTSFEGIITILDKTSELVVNYKNTNVVIIEKLEKTVLARKQELENTNNNVEKLTSSSMAYEELTGWEKGYYSYSNGKFVASDGDRTMKIPCKKGDKFIFTGYKGGADSTFKTVFEIDNNGNPTRTYYLPLYKMYVDTEYTIQGDTTSHVVFDLDPRYRFYVKQLKLTNSTNFIQQNKTKYITCWGDSLTAQGGWTTKLQELSGLTVFNGGTGGESVETIATRQGADRIVVNNITIPPGNDQTVDQCNITNDSTSLKTLLGNNVEPLRQSGQTHFNPCKIGDVEGNLYYSSGNLGTSHYYFVRKEPGSEVKIIRPTLLKTNFDMNNNDGIMILFLGTNGSEKHFADPSKLIKLHKLMIKHSKCIDYIVLGMHVGDKETNKLYEEQMKYEFGERFINLREYLVNYGLEDSGLVATEQDTQAIAIGKCPPQLLSDGTHYTEKTREVIGIYVYNKIKEIGIL